MADIAMLVAEEYERRTKSYMKGGNNNDGHEDISLVCSVYASMKRLDGVLNWIGEEKLQIVKNILEPKSTLGLAAINGLFSA